MRPDSFRNHLDNSTQGGPMLMEVPLEGGSHIVVEVDEDELTAGQLELASDQNSGSVVARARRALETSVAEIIPAIRAVCDGLRDAAPEELTVTFGLNVGGETGLIFAKGTAEVNFTVTMTWRPGGSQP